MKYKLRALFANISPILLLMIAAGFAVYTFTYILNLQMNYLSYALYDRSTLSQVYIWLHNYVAYKFIASILLLILAIICIVIYLLSYYNPIYLRISTLCMFALAFCYSIAENYTMLLSGRAAIRIWRLLHYCSFFALSAAILKLFYDLILSQKSRMLHTLVNCFFCFSCVNAYMQWLPLYIIFLGFAALLLAAQACFFHKQITAIAIRSLPPVFILIFVQYVIYNNQTQKYSVAAINMATKLYDLSILLIPMIVIYSFVLCLFQQKDVLFYTRDMKFQLHSINAVKSNLKTLTSTYVRPSLKQIDHDIRQLTSSGDASPKSLRNLKQIQTQLLNINLSLNRLDSYSTYQLNTQQLRQPFVNVKTIANMLSNSFRHNNLNYSGSHLHLAGNIGYAQIDPVRLVRALNSIALVMQEIDCGAEMHIYCERQQKQALLKIVFVRGSDQPVRLSSRNHNAIETSLFACRTVLRRSGGVIEFVSSPKLAVTLWIPVTEHVQPELPQTIHIAPPSDNAILFLSTDQAQRDQICMLLPSEGYKITVSDDALYFYSNLNLLHVFSLVIIGNLYYEVDYVDFINRLRTEFSMAQLPVLLLLPEGLTESEFHISTKFNSYLAPPYTAVSLQKAVNALVSTKENADRTLETTLKLLQSQMNPHFTFNAITSIMQICINEPQVAYELLESLSEYLRAHLTSLSSTRMSTIEEEMELIDAYLKIENARFGPRIQYASHISSDNEFPMLPLLIEPLVENAIKHGLAADRTIYIEVTVVQDQDLLTVRVKDTGIGMPQSTVQDILSDITPSTSIGLRNVQSRLKHFYGTTLTVESAPGAGTDIQFTINRKREPVSRNPLLYS